MITSGEIFESQSGRRIRVEGLIGVGGQGEAYWVTDLNTGQRGVLKVFFEKFVSSETIQRLHFLTSLQLNTVCPALLAPNDLINKKGRIGHYTLAAPGQPLEEFLKNPNSTFVESLQLAISLAHAVTMLHQRQIAHGDLHADNLLVNKTASVPELYVIDFDNFNAPRMPAPPCVGHNLYMAPELRMALVQGKPAIPDIWTDRYSLGVVMHEIILFKHVAAGADNDEAEFHKAMCSGWLHDPASADRPPGNIGGYPVEVLNADVARLFRKSLSLDRAERPSADQWEMALGKAINEVYVCPRPHCSGPCLIDASKSICPLCKHPYPFLKIVAVNGQMISLDRGAIPVGRDDLGGAKKVSARHAVFRRIGPETWLESLGSNGTYRWAGSQWIKLPDNKPVLVQHNDRLRFADMEAQVLWL